MLSSVRYYHAPSSRRLFAACFAFVVLTLQADEFPDPRARFTELDSEIQAIKSEILEINRDILLLEEAMLYPRAEQWVVLVSVADGSPMIPGQITLRLNGNTIADHNYSSREGAALRQGGVHRLYTGRLHEGEYQLDIAVSGRLTQDQGFQGQHSAAVNKIPGAKYMELQLVPADAPTHVSIVIREWQQ